ncbi:type II toxin-antitoxin system VapC family toxin [Rhodopila sp.]|uniref:type II toxin-antitoxin system VapC family toxin n=1 Tax=Rhodopila sp. TaxID=2480087 RepID=UPI003D0D5AA8
MRITPDTNVLVRAAVPVRDATSEDGKQSAHAREWLRNATLIAVTLPTLCEFVWVLHRAYKYPKTEIATAIRKLCMGTSVVCDRQALEAGLIVLQAGGDFADGVIAFAGRAIGGETFASFDQDAVRLLQRSGHDARIPGEETAAAGG